MSGRRGFLQRLKGIFSGHEQGYELEDEDLDFYGTIVEVVEPVGPDRSDGRIAMQGSTWKATSLEQELAVGTKAKVLFRDNLVWVVEEYNGALSPGEKLNLGA